MGAVLRKHGFVFYATYTGDDSYTVYTKRQKNGAHHKEYVAIVYTTDYSHKLEIEAEIYDADGLHNGKNFKDGKYRLVVTAALNEPTDYALFQEQLFTLNEALEAMAWG
jgi:hypothetical protein